MGTGMSSMAMILIAAMSMEEFNPALIRIQPMTESSQERHGQMIRESINLSTMEGRWDNCNTTRVKIIMSTMVGIKPSIFFH